MQQQISKSNTLESKNRMTDRFEHTANLTVPSFVDRNHDDCFLPVRVNISIFHLSRSCDTVLQYNASTELVQLGTMRYPFNGS
ncbi:hypothetical protein D1872_301510 [compost metagenome]